VAMDRAEDGETVRRYADPKAEVLSGRRPNSTPTNSKRRDGETITASSISVCNMNPTEAEVPELLSRIRASGPAVSGIVKGEVEHVQCTATHRGRRRSRRVGG